MNNVKQFDLFPLPQALQYIEEPLKKSIFKLNAYYVTYSSCCGHEPDNIVKIGIIIEDRMSPSHIVFLIIPEIEQARISH